MASSSSPESSSESESASEDDSASDSGTEQKKKKKSPSKPKVEGTPGKEMSLLDLDDFSPTPVTTSKSSVLSPSLFSDLEGLSLSNVSSVIQVSSPAFLDVKSHSLLHKMTGKGLSAQYHFPRQTCLAQPSMVAVQISLTNGSDQPLDHIHIDKSPAGLDIHCFNTI
ncbi:AP-3 complex subunit beta-1-like, partial [Osmerus eperlanus]|uniref:AP-3 complex subunit beta-1-like n=1 Tax=Osmerus eperlanus TaxID=29151 RepID=UPI002E11AB48